ncbi:hypothetical protein HMPREF1871_01264 [Gemelliphila asaccharolytica]|uniref:Uncharacterized protein n=2 Tax=Gemelliphila asaccharolytica TaxID=502393 RepID=A0ABR5TKB2_9BACL|nr:hypothetical protein HMPREF1871_01264 [Gemella asaccharolytica]
MMNNKGGFFMRKQFKFISVVFASSILLTPLYNLNYSNNLANSKEKEISTISENEINAIKRGDDN